MLIYLTFTPMQQQNLYEEFRYSPIQKDEILDNCFKHLSNHLLQSLMYQ